MSKETDPGVLDRSQGGEKGPKFTKGREVEDVGRVSRSKNFY